jgi:ribose transport system substrate-binding protein
MGLNRLDAAFTSIMPALNARKLPTAIAFSAIVLAGIGCGREKEPEATPAPKTTTGTSSTSGGSSTAAAGPLTTGELDTIDKAAKPYKLVLIVKTRNNPFFDPMIKAFEAEAAAMGAQSEVQAPQQETDKEAQFGYVQTVAAKGADAIVIAPADSKAIIPALKAAQDKKILVINLDNRVDKTEAASQGLELGGYVGADNEAGGKLAGEAMARALGGKGKVLIIEGIRGADNAEARKRGFESGAKGLEIVGHESAEWDTEKANAKTASLLTAHPDVTGIFCANDKMAIGALKAVEQAGKKGKIAVIGYDNIPDVQPALKSGDMAATIEQHPDLMGKYGVRLAVAILNGKVQKGRELLVPLEAKRK